MHTYIHIYIYVYIGSNVKRAVQNNFADVYRQRVIDMLHGQDTSGAKSQGPPQEPPTFASSEPSADDNRGIGGASHGGGVVNMEISPGELDGLVSDDDAILLEHLQVGNTHAFDDVCYGDAIRHGQPHAHDTDEWRSEEGEVIGDWEEEGVSRGELERDRDSGGEGGRGFSEEIEML